jgi:DNA-binding XRE family transcriptional regulator
VDKREAIAIWFHRGVERQLLGRKGAPLMPHEVAGLRELGTELRLARARLGWSQRDLEYASGVDQTTISRLENGRLTHLNLVRLAALIEALRGRLDLSGRYR